MEQNFMKALPMDKALDPDTIIAYAMNGEYLRHMHGAPMRLIVPGWAGNWSVKWLEKVEVLDHMPPVFYQTKYFIYGDGFDDPNRHMVTAMGVKSIIIEPRENESPLPLGSYPITGIAYGGREMITRVEISTDGGESWTDAQLEEPREKWMWARFFHLWDAKPGKYTLMARAYDESGRQQPVTPWNFQKKMFDGIVPVEIEIVPD
jgi:DMSO/TMAO reductase YedYZ molybdopterin-dependent catalytic subunit